MIDLIWFFFPLVVGFLAWLAYPRAKASLGAPIAGDPYRGSTYVPKVGRNLPLHHIHKWNMVETCPKCGDIAVRPFQSGRLCYGNLGSCPVNREHFHWLCRCGHRWLGATKDKPGGGEAA